MASQDNPNGTLSFDEEFDIIVVGYGFAGALAAITAADAGCRVLLAEKAENPGGISICSGGAMRSAHDADTVVMFSALWTFGHLLDVDPGELASEVMKILLGIVGPHRTLVLPAYTNYFARSRYYI